MDEKQGPICARVGNLCDQCLRNQEQPRYNSGYNIGNNRGNDDGAYTGKARDRNIGGETPG